VEPVFDWKVVILIFLRDLIDYLLKWRKPPR